MVAASYPSYLGRSYLVASSAVDRLRSLGPVNGAPSLADVQTYWQDRAQIVGQLHAAVAHAAEYHGLVCQVALPTTLAAAKTLSAKQSLLDADPAWVLAGTFEALRKIPAPIAGAYAAPLTMSTIAGSNAPALVARACEALEGVAAFRDALAGATGTPNAAADMLLRIATISAAPRDLDRLMVEWIALLDSIGGGTAVNVNTALAAARAKADILIEALADHANASAARWELVKELVQP
jgi:hypothetical protein